MFNFQRSMFNFQRSMFNFQNVPLVSAWPALNPNCSEMSSLRTSEMHISPLPIFRRSRLFPFGVRCSAFGVRYSKNQHSKIQRSTLPLRRSVFDVQNSAFAPLFTFELPINFLHQSIGTRILAEFPKHNAAQLFLFEVFYLECNGLFVVKSGKQVIFGVVVIRRF